MGKKQGIGVFGIYWTKGVDWCISIGIAVGQWFPDNPQKLRKF